MKKNKRKFIKTLFSIFAIPIIFKPFIANKNYFQNKFKIYKKKYSKIWILDLNDN